MRIASLALAAIGFGCAANSASRERSCGVAANGLATTDSTVYDTTQVTTQAEILAGPQLHYPDGPRREGIQGRVVLALVVNTDGRVEPRSVTLVQRLHPAMDAEAKRYALLASFQPACLRGSPVRVRVRIPIDFRILR